MSETDRKVPRWLLPAGLALLIAALVSIALLRGPVSLDPDTAEGAVQEYLVALSEERWDDATTVIHAETLGQCTGDDIARFGTVEFTAELGHQGGFGGVSERFTEIGSESGQPFEPAVPDTLVDVTINHDTDAGLGSSWSEFVTFEMSEEDGFWWITGDPWPYFVWNCR